MTDDEASLQLVQDHADRGEFAMQVIGGGERYRSLNAIFAADAYHWARGNCTCWPGREYGDPPSDYCKSKLHYDRLPPKETA